MSRSSAQFADPALPQIKEVLIASPARANGRRRSGAGDATSAPPLPNRAPAAP